MRKRTILCAVVCLVCLASPARTQSSTASITGTVVDDTGAIVPDVAVTVVNLGTGLQRQTTAGKDGLFVVPLLPPGRYSLTAERDGFAPTQIRELVLNVNDE